MSNLLLYLVVALFAWMGFALFSPEGAVLTPGFLILMACLSVLVWERVVVPMQRRAEARRARARQEVAYRAPQRVLPPRPVQPYPVVRGQAPVPNRPATTYRPLAA